MWTPSITEKLIVDGKLFVTVQFVNGTNSLVQTFQVMTNLDNFKQQVKNRIADLEKQDVVFSSLTSGVFDYTLPDPTPPTPAELAARDWIINFNRWVTVKDNLIDTGILTGTETKVVALKDKVIADFKPAYIDLL